MAFPITWEGYSTDISISYNSPIMDMNKKYKISFDAFECDNSFANIDAHNNIFRYSTDSGVSWKNLIIKKGSYEIDTLNKEIRRLMFDNGDYDETATTVNKRFYITLSINDGTKCSIIFITNPQYRVDFTAPNTMRELLGFGEEILSKPYNESTVGIQASKILSIYVNTNIATGGRSNAKKRPYIFSFNPNSVGSGYRLYEKNNSNNNNKDLYITNTGLTEFRVWLEDQDGNPMEFLHSVNSMTLRAWIYEVRDD